MLENDFLRELIETEVVTLEPYNITIEMEQPPKGWELYFNKAKHFNKKEVLFKHPKARYHRDFKKNPYSVLIPLSYKIGDIKDGNLDVLDVDVVEEDDRWVTILKVVNRI